MSVNDCISSLWYRRHGMQILHWQHSSCFHFFKPLFAYNWAVAEAASSSSPLYRQTTDFLIYMWFLRVDVSPLSLPDAVKSDMLTVSRWLKTLPQQQNTLGIVFCTCSIQHDTKWLSCKKRVQCPFSYFCLADIVWFILDDVPLFNVFYKRWFLFSS